MSIRFLIITLFFSIYTIGQNFGQYASALIMDTNVVNPNDGPSGINDWFCITTCDPSDPNTIFPNSQNLNGGLFGTRVQFTNSLQFDGGEFKTFKSPTANVCGIDIYYRYYLQSATPPPFQMAQVTTVKADCSGGQFTDFLGPCSDGDQKWQVGEQFPGSQMPFNIDITQGCPVDYFFEVYYVVRGSNTSTSLCDENVVINNNGNNYIATYTLTGTLNSELSSNIPTCAVGDFELSVININKTNPNNVTFLWTGPNGYENTNQSITVAAEINNNGTYQVVVTDDCGLFNTHQIQVNINPLPEVPTSDGNIEVCETEVINSIQPIVTNTDGSTFVWYDALTGGNLVTNPSLSSVGSVTFYAQGLFEGTGCISNERTPVSLTIFAAPPAPTFIENIIVCETDPIAPITAIATPAIGTNVVWYDEAIGGNVVIDPSLSQVGTVTYYAAGVDNTTNCESLTRTAVNLTITAAPVAPTGDAVQTFCNNATYTLQDLTVVGSNISWFDSSNNPLPNNTVLNNNTSYFASQTVDGCESLTLLEVEVNLVEVSTPTFDFGSTLDICQNATPILLPNISSNNIQGTWNPTVIDNTSSGIYTFTPNDTFCTENFVLNVAINTPITPEFSFGMSIEICESNNPPTLPQTSLNEIDGTWSPPNVSNQFSGTYTFTPNSNFCAETVVIEVTVIEAIIPEFYFDNQLTYCYNASNVIELPSISNNNIVGSWSPLEINPLQSDVYTFRPQDSQCGEYFILNVTILNPFDFNIEWQCNENHLELYSTNASGALSFDNAQYQWFYNGQPITGASQSMIIVDNNVLGIARPLQYPLVFDLEITNSDGCVVTKTLEMNAHYCDIQKGISMNDDGLNDFFDLQLHDVKHLTVFNRYGKKVYDKANYTNQWRGQSYNGKKLPDGTYYYHIEYNNGVQKTGWVYLVSEINN